MVATSCFVVWHTHTKFITLSVDVVKFYCGTNDLLWINANAIKWTETFLKEEDIAANSGY